MKKFLMLLAWSVLALLTVHQAHAAPSSEGGTLNKIWWPGYTGNWNSAVNACKSYAGKYDAPTDPAQITTTYYDQSSFRCGWKGNPYQIDTRRVGVCTDQQILFDRTTGWSQCPGDTQAPVTCQTGQVQEKTIYQGVKGSTTFNYAFPVAVDGCMIRVTSLKGCTSQPTSAAPNDVYCTYRYVVNQPAVQGVSNTISTGEPTGALKEEIVSGAAAANGEGCPTGTVSTGVSASGMVQCAGSGTNPKSGESTSPTTVKPPATTTNADGSTTTKQDTVSTNKDGSTTTTTSQVTTMGDGTKTTSESSVTGKAADGTSGVKDVKTGTDPNKADLCALHPELNLCKNSTFTGTCGEVACTGDAIQCGILRAAAKKACDDQTVSDTLKNATYTAKGQGMMDGVADPTLPTKQNATTWTIPGSLDNQGWLGGGACFPDKQFSVRGYSFTLSFTKACDPLVALRYALMIIALLASFRMLSGAILKD